MIKIKDRKVFLTRTKREEIAVEYVLANVLALYFFGKPFEKIGARNQQALVEKMRGES